MSISSKGSGQQIDREPPSLGSNTPVATPPPLAPGEDALPTAPIDDLKTEPPEFTPPPSLIASLASAIPVEDTPAAKTGPEFPADDHAASSFELDSDNADMSPPLPATPADILASPAGADETGAHAAADTAPPPIAMAGGAGAGAATAAAMPQPEPHQATDPAPRRVARRRPAGPVRGRIAANDDVPSIGGLIYSLEQKPSRKVFRLAAIVSAVWAVLGGIFAFMTLAPNWAENQSVAALLVDPTTFYCLAAIIVPIAICWLLAVLNWHIASLALRSSTMTEVAIRLAEPDRHAEQSIASLGQAVRRQVSFMNDAVSRALGRAGELEALVHNQVADLERSYESNERRIRGLINELGGERHALLNTSNNVTETLQTLGTEIPQLIEKLSTQQVTLSNIIRGAGDNLEALEGSLSESTGRFESVLGDRTQHLQTVLEDYTTAFSSALGTRTEQMRTAFDGYMETLDATLGNRTENLQTVFEEYARALDTTMANRADALDQQLVERTQSLDAAFQRRLEHFDEQITRSTVNMDHTVNEKAELLTNALEMHARSFRDTMTRQAADLDDSVMNGINAVHRTSENITRQTMRAIDNLSQQSHLLEDVSEQLFTRINGVSERVETQGEKILRVAGQLEDANTRIDGTLQNRHDELTQTLSRLSGKADDFGKTIAGYSNNLEGSLTEMEERARMLTQELRHSTEGRSRELMEELERVKYQTENESQRAMEDLRQRFQSVSTDLSRDFQSLTERLASASDETRQQAALAAEELSREHARLRQQAAMLPQSTQETAETMRQALEDQVRAFEQLTSISKNARSARDVTVPEPPYNASARTGSTPQVSSSPFARRVQQQEQAANQQSFQPRDNGNNSVDSSNWSFGDLLARASHEDSGGRDGDGNANDLDIGMIARAVDTATASTIWNRIRAGQRGVMVRSIYAPEARALFDGIVNKLQSDSDLAGLVNRYLNDFENIVAEADRRDPSGRAAHTELISETGRVYLFLAHAAGRLS